MSLMLHCIIFAKSRENLLVGNPVRTQMNRPEPPALSDHAREGTFRFKMAKICRV